MKKIYYSLTLVCALLTASLSGCSYNDSPLWEEIEKVKGRVSTLEEAVKSTNADITALQKLVDAFGKNLFITGYQAIDNGYVISFSDGTTATISNGIDGLNGTNAPVISVKQDTDGNYYWTQDGEFLLSDGEKIRANGIDGQDGMNAVAPKIRINPDTNEWEVSTDNGSTWTSTGVNAKGWEPDPEEAPMTIFKSVDVSQPDVVTFVLQDGTEIKLLRYDETAPRFALEEAPAEILIGFGQTKTYKAIAENVSEVVILHPLGWVVTYKDNVLSITAPAKDKVVSEPSGILQLVLTSLTSSTEIFKVPVRAVEFQTKNDLKVLTFEDIDAKFAPYTLYNDTPIKTWSDLIDSPEYGGPLTYTDMATIEDGYYWYDEGNTWLFHSFTTPYWTGGQVISNYTIDQFENPGDGNQWFERQLSILPGGHNGSKNFAVHYGYVDFFNTTIYDAKLQGFEFADGVERVVDHMYVTNTAYTLHSLTYGDGFNTPAEETTFFNIVAIGYNADGDEVGKLEFPLCTGRTMVKDWQKFDLKSLGKVAKIVFNFNASEDQSGSYGLNTPAYFAYDDVAVWVEEQVPVE